MSMPARAQPNRGAAPASVKNMRLKISPNKRYLVTDKGEPFFYLADTAWTLFRRLDRDEAEAYLQNRKAKGFTVIQAYLFRGLEVRNRNGDLTLIDRDPAKPNEAWFKHVDWVVNRANELGLVMGIVASKGDHIRQRQWPVNEAVFNRDNAAAFGKFLGDRYKNNAVIWYLGGDTVPADKQDIWVALARGLKEGCQGVHLVSYHGPGPSQGKDYSSSFWFHDADWLDFNVIQSGHGTRTKPYEFVTHDYDLKPPKPTIDMEARYENHPDGSRAMDRIDAHAVRQTAYWDLLAGAAGFGYGCNDIWQFFDEQRLPSPKDYSFPFQRLLGTTHWRKAMNFEGASSMGLMRRLFELRPWHQLVPDQSVIAKGQGNGIDHVQAARAEDGSFLVVYVPTGKPLGLQLGKLTVKEVKAQWYDPRKGTWVAAGRFPNTAVQKFVPPSSGAKNDWVLVVEDGAVNLPTEPKK
jgi:hypothetical protein